MGVVYQGHDAMRPGQIIANSHDRFPPNGWFSKGNRLISGKSRLVKYD